MAKNKLHKKIVRLYHTLKYPGSFGGLDAFQKSLKANSGIDISRNKLRNILLNSELYATSMRNASKFLKRNIIADGVNIQSTSDIFYIKVMEKTYFVLLVVG